jgi:SpoVK/Ycf46/Vps4 family AAA+-type ATPase
VRTLFYVWVILVSPIIFQIALLHGPPGTGKTLTAEAVAEHLKRPLYVLSSLELSTTPATLEKKLGNILKVRDLHFLFAFP